MTNDDIKSIIQKAIQHRRAGHYVDAIDTLAPILAETPQNEWARVETAESIAAGGNSEAAEAFLVAGLALGPAPNLRIALSDFASRRGASEIAIDHARRAVADAPASSKCAANLVNRLGSAKQFSEMTKFCENFVAQNINDSDRSKVLQAWSEFKSVYFEDHVNMTAAIQNSGRDIRNAVIVMMIKDESDIINANLNHHYSIGFRYFAISNNNSSDATGEIVRAFRDNHPDCTVLYVEDPIVAYFQDIKTTAITHYAVDFLRSVDADIEWVFPLDADEFIAIPVGADLKGVLEEMTATRAKVGVYCLCNGAADPPIEEASEIAEPFLTFPFRKHFKYRPVTKVFYRSSPGAKLEMGNHFVLSVATSLSDIAVLAQWGIWLGHFPNRSVAQMRSKIVNGGHAIRRTGVQVGGGHWLRHYQRYVSDGDQYIRMFLEAYGKDVKSMITNNN